MMCTEQTCRTRSHSEPLEFHQDYQPSGQEMVLKRNSASSAQGRAARIRERGGEVDPDWALREPEGDGAPGRAPLNYI